MDKENLLVKGLSELGLTITEETDWKSLINIMKC